jgi:hypothetical protein
MRRNKFVPARMARLNPEEVLERLRSTAPEANFEHRNLVLVGVQRSLYSWALFLGSLEYLLDLENGLFLSLLLGVSALCFQQAQRSLEAELGVEFSVLSSTTVCTRSGSHDSRLSRPVLTPHHCGPATYARVGRGVPTCPYSGLCSTAQRQRAQTSYVPVVASLRCNARKGPCRERLPSCRLPGSRYRAIAEARLCHKRR